MTNLLSGFVRMVMTVPSPPIWPSAVQGAGLQVSEWTKEQRDYAFTAITGIEHLILRLERSGDWFVVLEGATPQEQLDNVLKRADDAVSKVLGFK